MDILNVIQNVGFPIACVIFMGIYGGRFIQSLVDKMNTSSKEHVESLQKMNDTHKEEMQTFADALNNNTKVMSEFLEHLRKEGKGND